MRAFLKKFTRRRILVLLAAVLLIVAGVFAYFQFFRDKGVSGVDNPPSGEAYSICLTPPTDGSKPEDHTALENIGYIIGRLSARDFYHNESVSKATASALFGTVNVTQNVVGSKDYKDGVLIVSSISTSASAFAPSKAIQRFYGEDKAVVRNAASDNKNDWDGIYTEWSSAAPSEVLTPAEHINRYGLWGTEFSDYVINEKTLLSTDAVVTREGDEYVLVVSLSVSSENGMEDATEYYKRQMKTMGDLDSFPKFSSAELTFRFGEDWTIYSLQTNEVYTSQKGFSADCVGENVVTYSYEEEKVDVSDYEEYFIHYADAAVTGPAEEERTALDYLSAGFAPVLTEENTAFSIDGTIAGTPVSGAAVLNMQGGSLNSLRLAIGDLSAAYEQGSLFLRYKDFLGRLSADALFSQLSFGSDSFDLSSLESAIAAGKLTTFEGGATLSCELPLGVLVLPLEFGFSETEDVIAWSYIDARLELFGVEISLHVLPGNAEEVPEVDFSQAVDLAPFVENIRSLIEGKNFEVSLDYANEQFALSGKLNVNAADGLAVGGELVINYAGSDIPVNFTLIGKEVWLDIGQIKLHTRIEDAEEALGELLGESISVPELDVAALVNSLLNLDYDSLIKGLALNEEGFALSLDGDLLLSALAPVLGDIDLTLGALQANYSLSDNAFALSALGADISLRGGNAQVSVPADSDDYVTTDVIRIAKYIKELAESVMNGETQFDLSAKIGENALDAKLLLAMQGGKFEKIQLGLGSMQALFDGKNIALSYKDFFGKLSLSDLSAQLPASGASLDISALLDSVLGATLIREGDILTLSVTLTLGETELPLTLRLSDGADGVALKEASLSLELFGMPVSATLKFAEQEVSFPALDLSQAVDLAPFVENIRSLIEGKNFEVSLDYANEQFALSGKLNVNAADGLAVGGELVINYAGSDIPVNFTLIGKEVWLNVGQIKLHTRIEDAEEALGELLGESVSVPELDVAALITSLLNFDYDSLVKGLSLTEEGLSVSVDGDLLLSALSPVLGDIDLTLGTLEANYSLSDNAFALSVLGADVSLKASNAQVSVPADSDDYVTTDVIRIAKYIKELTESIMDGETQFDLSATIGENALDAKLLLAMQGGKFEKIQLGLGSMQALFDGKNIALSYKDLFGKLSLSDLSAQLPASGASLDISALIDSVLGATLIREGDVLTLSVTLTFGETELPLTLRLSDGADGVALKDASLSLELLGMPVSATLKFAEQEVSFPALDLSQAVDLAPFVENIRALIEGKNFEVMLDYANEQFALSGKLNVNAADGLAVGGELTLSVAGADIPVNFTLIGKEVWLNVGQIKLHTRIEDAEEALGELLGESISVPELDVAALVNSLLNLDYDSLIKGLSLNEEGFALSLDGDLLLAGLAPVLGDIDLTLGTLQANYSLSDNAFALSVLGADVSLKASNAQVSVPADSDDYVTTDVIRIAKYIKELAESIMNGETQFDLSATIGENALDAKLLLAMQGGKFEKIQLGLGSMQALFDGKNIALSYKDLFGKLSVSDLSAQLPASGASFDVSTLIDSVLGATLIREGDVLTLSVTLTLGETELPLTLRLYDGAEGVALKDASLSLELLGMPVSATLKFAEQTISFPALDLAQATDLAPFVENIRALIEGKSFEVSLDYANEQFALSGKLNVNAADGLAVGGELVISYAGSDIPVNFTLIGKEVWLDIGQIKLHTRIEDAEEALGELLGESVSVPELDVAALVNSLLNLDYDSLVKGLSLNEEGFALSLDGDLLLSALSPVLGEIDLTLGTLEAEYSLSDNAFALSVLGADVSLKASNAQVVVPTGEYVEFSAIRPFLDSIKALVSTKQMHIELSGETTVQGTLLAFDLSADVCYENGLQISLSAQINGTHLVRVFYEDGILRFAYNGYGMTVSENEISDIVKKFAPLLGQQTDASGVLADPMLFFGEGGFDLGAFIESVKIATAGEELSVAMDLSLLLEGLQADGITLRALDSGIAIRAERISAFGLDVNGLAACIESAEQFVSPDFSDVVECENVFEFLFNAYTQLAAADAVSLSVEYETESLYFAIDGQVQFEHCNAEDPAEVTLNLAFDATILEGGKESPTGSHYIRLVIVREKLYIGYSMVGFEGGNPLNVSMNVSDLISAGKTVLPILGPILGIGEDVYYYNFVISILDGYVKTINSSVFGVMDAEEWCDLILGIIGEYAPDGIARTASQETSIEVDLSGVRLHIVGNGLDVEVGALKDAEPVTAPSDADSYIDASTIAQLLQDVLNAYEFAQPGQGYYLSGTAKLSFLGKEATVGVDIRVGFDEANDVYLYIRLHMDPVSLIIPIIESETTTEIILKNGNLYMIRERADRQGEKSEQTIAYRFKEKSWIGTYYYQELIETTVRDVREVRVASLSEAFKDTASILDNVFFMLNLSDSVKSLVGTPESGSGSGDSGKDVGDMVGGYTYTKNEDGSGCYGLTIDLGVIANNSAFKDVEIDIYRDAGGMLTHLTVNTKLVSVFNVTVELDFVSPGADSLALEFYAAVEEAVESTGVQVPETGYARTEIVENVQVTRALKDTSYWLSDPYGKGSYNEWMIDEFLAS